MMQEEQPYGSYQSPLSSRYASQEMLTLFSQRTRIRTWRRLWTELAHAEHNLGLPVSSEQVAALEANMDSIDFPLVAWQTGCVPRKHYTAGGLCASWPFDRRSF